MAGCQLRSADDEAGLTRVHAVAQRAGGFVGVHQPASGAGGNSWHALRQQLTTVTYSCIS